MSNFLAARFDRVLGRIGQRAMAAARRALPQRCELCAGSSGSDLVCAACTRDLPRLGAGCPVCALPTDSGVVCGSCLAHPPAFDATTAAFVYAFPVDRLIQAFKYQGRLALAHWCAAAILAERESRPRPDPDLMVALPLSLERQRERGYNQAAEIARALMARTGVPLLGSGVRRVRAAPPQATLPWSARAQNVRGAFGCEVDLSGRRLAVIDDVMTTGSSLAELAKTLKAAGAATVENWVVARTLPPHAN